MLLSSVEFTLSRGNHAQKDKFRTSITLKSVEGDRPQLDEYGGDAWRFWVWSRSPPDGPTTKKRHAKPKVLGV